MKIGSKRKTTLNIPNPSQIQIPGNYISSSNSVFENYRKIDRKNIFESIKKWLFNKAYWITETKIAFSVSN